MVRQIFEKSWGNALSPQMLVAACRREYSEKIIYMQYINNCKNKCFWGKIRLLFLEISMFIGSENHFAAIVTLSKLHYVDLSNQFCGNEISASRWKPWKWMILFLILSMKNLNINHSLNSPSQYFAETKILFVSSTHSAPSKHSHNEKLCHKR